MAHASDSAPAASFRDPTGAPAAAHHLDDATLVALRALTARGADPVMRLDGLTCGCGSAEVVAAGVFDGVAASGERRFAVVFACRRCKRFAPVEPRCEYVVPPVGP